MVIRGVIFQNTLLYTVNRYNYVKKEGTPLLRFFIKKEC